MKATLLFAFLFLLFSCRNGNSGDRQQSAKADTLKITAAPVIRQPDSIKAAIHDTASKPYISPVSQADIDAMMPGDTISATEVLFKGQPILTNRMKDMQRLLKQADSVTRDTNDVGPILTYWFKFGSLGYYVGQFGDSGLISMSVTSIEIHERKITVGGSEKVLKELFPKSYAIKDSTKNNSGEIIVHFNDMDSFDLRFYMGMDGKIYDIEYVINEYY